MLGAMFMVSGPIAQVQRVAPLGFRRPIEPPRCPQMSLSPDRGPPRGTDAVHRSPWTGRADFVALASFGLLRLCEAEVCERTRNDKRQPTHPERYGETADLHLPTEDDPKEMHYRHHQE
jgi:hypothetical protein